MWYAVDSSGIEHRIDYRGPPGSLSYDHKPFKRCDGKQVNPFNLSIGDSRCWYCERNVRRAH